MQSVMEQRNILHNVQRRKANWIGDMLRRNCLLKHVMEEKLEVKGIRGRRCKQILDDPRNRQNTGK